MTTPSFLLMSFGEKFFNSLLLYALLYAYRFGTIGFLELLDAFEEILRVHTPQSNTRSDAA